MRDAVLFLLRELAASTHNPVTQRKALEHIEAGSHPDLGYGRVPVVPVGLASVMRENSKAMDETMATLKSQTDPLPKAHPVVDVIAKQMLPPKKD